MAAVILAVLEERMRQNEKWGEQNHPDGTGHQARVMKPIGDIAIGRNMQMIPAHLLAKFATRATDEHEQLGLVTWADILLEEVFEALAEDDPAKLRTELVQVAAVATQWVEAIDRRTA